MTAAGRQHVSANRSAGFTLLELTWSLLALGVLGLLVSTAYRGADDTRAIGQARADAEAARQALRGFLLANRRLPCPDSDGDGREGDGTGACPAALMIGWLPHETLALPPSTGARPLYGVYRNGAVGADLVAPSAATGAGSFEHDAIAALTASLAAAAQQPAAFAQIYLTGDGGPLGPADCAANAAANPALTILMPVTDRDGDGDRFDGLHAGYSTAPGRCFAAPSLAPYTNYDDVLIAESPQALLGWLTANVQ